MYAAPVDWICKSEGGGGPKMNIEFCRGNLLKSSHLGDREGDVIIGLTIR